MYSFCYSILISSKSKEGGKMLSLPLPCRRLCRDFPIMCILCDRKHAHTHTHTHAHTHMHKYWIKYLWIFQGETRIREIQGVKLRTKAGYCNWSFRHISSLPLFLPESWDIKIWSWVSRDSEPRMTVLARASQILGQYFHHSTTSTLKIYSNSPIILQ
jgi:hypothetical protein